MMKNNGQNPHSATPSSFGFTIVDNQVTAMERVMGSHTVDLPLPTNATFTVDSGSVVETVTRSNSVEVLEFSPDAAHSGLYQLASDTITVSSPETTHANGTTGGYTFTISGDTVTAMGTSFTKASGATVTHDLHLMPTSSFSVSDGTITETLVQGNVVETIQFVSPGSDGVYAVASDTKTFILPSTATTQLSVDPFERMQFTIDSSGTVTAALRVLPDGSTATAASKSSISYSQLAAGYVLETITRGKTTCHEVFHDGNGDGVYTAVAHGTGTAVDLVGLQSQLTAAIEAVV